MTDFKSIYGAVVEDPLSDGCASAVGPLRTTLFPRVVTDLTDLRVERESLIPTLETLEPILGGLYADLRWRLEAML